MYKSLQYKHAIYFTCVFYWARSSAIFWKICSSANAGIVMSLTSPSVIFMASTQWDFNWDFKWGYHVVNGNVI